MAKARAPRSPFQASDDFPSIFILRGSSVVEEKQAYLETAYVEYINPERTMAVASRSYGGSYGIALRTLLTPEDVLMEESDYLTGDGYARLRERGIWYIVEDVASAKTRAREYAETMLALIADVTDPLRVAIDGKHSPALTIALKKVETEREYYRDDRRRSVVTDIASEAGVHPALLALAIKEDRLIWATPPVAPRQVLVVVREEATANLSERLVDEITRASGEVEGLGRIVFDGSVSEYLLHMRQFRQARAVEEILDARDDLINRLSEIQGRVTNLLEKVGKGEVVGRGFHDTLYLGREIEQAQAAATRYAYAVQVGDLPGEFAESLRTGTYTSINNWGPRSDAYDAVKALSAITGADYGNRY